MQQYFQMTITKILRVCYLTHTDTTKLVYHWENYRGHWWSYRDHWDNYRDHWGNYRGHWENCRYHWGDYGDQ